MLPRMEFIEDIPNTAKKKKKKKKKKIVEHYEIYISNT
jgi:hypothetical protein